MDAEIVGLIGAMVAAAVQVGKVVFNIDGQKAHVWALAFSILGVLLWSGAFLPAWDRTLIWKIPVTMLVVASAAVGVHSGGRATVNMVQGKGTGQG